MATTLDSQWPSAATLMHSHLVPGRTNVALVGVPTFATSLSARSSTSTPLAIRDALTRYSTWSFLDRVDLAEFVALVDHGDVVDPDGDGGGERAAALLSSIPRDVAMTIVLGGDNAATWHALSALSAGDIESYGLITLDAHLDLREGRSNGSPVAQLLDGGLDPRHVVQVGLGDFSNSPPYAQRALQSGITLIERDAFRRETISDIAQRAIDVAGAGGRSIYVDIDLDVCDRSVVPGCPSAAPGGLSADEVRSFVREVTSWAKVVAIDITEIDVEGDSLDQRTVRLAALLVLEALAGVKRRSS